jgi:hypothetical protein
LVNSAEDDFLPELADRNLIPSEEGLPAENGEWDGVVFRWNLNDQLVAFGFLPEVATDLQLYLNRGLPHCEGTACPMGFSRLPAQFEFEVLCDVWDQERCSGPSIEKDLGPHPFPMPREVDRDHRELVADISPLGCRVTIDTGGVPPSPVPPVGRRGQSSITSPAGTR